MTVTLMVVLGLSFGCVGAAQEARWDALSKQVKALYHQGKYRKAIPVAKEALKVAEETFGPNHPNAPISMIFLGEPYLLQWRYAKAEPLLKRALAIWEKSVPSNPNVVTTLKEMAELYKQMSRDN